MEQILQEILSKLDSMSSTMATKNELEEIKNNMATKSELEEIKSTMATKGELSDLKDIVLGIDSRLEMVYQQVVRNTELISMKADKEDIDRINKRLDIHLVRISKLEEEVTLIKQAL